MDIVTRANKLISEGIALLPEDAKEDFKAAANKDIYTYQALENAIPVVGDSEEKKAMLEAVAIREANQMAATLWRLELITPEIEKEFRELPALADVVAKYNTLLEPRKAREEELSEQFRVLSEEKREQDIFMGIINGVSPEKAEQQYEEFRKTQQQALGGK